MLRWTMVVLLSGLALAVIRMIASIVAHRFGNVSATDDTQVNPWEW